jgi:ribosomal-protein-alanine N-acetyltransferase
MFAIRTKRLVLRDLALRDVPRLNEFFTDRVVTRKMGFVRTRNLRETRAWVKRAIFHNRKRPRFAYSLAVVTKKDRKIVGWIGFGDTDKKKRHIAERDFGFAFRRDCWSKGYGTESLRGITDFIFCELKGRSFFGDHDVTNPASGRVMAKCGFRRMAPPVRGIRAHSHAYILTRASWLKRRRG